MIENSKKNKVRLVCAYRPNINIMVHATGPIPCTLNCADVINHLYELINDFPPISGKARTQ